MSLLPPVRIWIWISVLATSAGWILSAVGQLIIGPLSDRFGRQMPVLIGLCIFVLGAIGCAYAVDLAGLLIGRSIQAVGACTMAVLSRAIARDLFDGQELTKAMAAITIATAAAPGFSPLLGSGLELGIAILLHQENLVIGVDEVRHRFREGECAYPHSV